MEHRMIRWLIADDWLVGLSGCQHANTCRHLRVSSEAMQAVVFRHERNSRFIWSSCDILPGLAGIRENEDPVGSTKTERQRLCDAKLVSFWQGFWAE